MKYRNRPVEIDAIQLTGETVDDVIAFTNNRISVVTAEQGNPGTCYGWLNVINGEVKVVHDGDYIIKDGDKFRVCMPGLFEKLYMKVEESENG